MKRCVVVAALSALALAGCRGSDDDGEPASGDVVAAPSSTASAEPDVKACGETFKDGQVVTKTAAATEECTKDGNVWIVFSLDCEDGRTLVHPVTGYGFVGEPYHQETKPDGGIPDPAFNTCMGG